LVAIRELSFDRYPIPCFYIKQNSGKFITNDSSNFKVLPAAGSGSPLLNLDYVTNNTLDKITNALNEGGYPIAYSQYYSGTDAPSILLKYTDKSLSTPAAIFRRFFVSDLVISQTILLYFAKILRVDVLLADLETKVLELTDKGVRHLTLWSALNLVDQRQLFEVTGDMFNSMYTDGTGLIVDANNGPVENISVQIGSVFSLQEDNNATSKYFQDDFNRIGSDNVLGNKNSFWFKLFLWLRDKLEQEFGDFFYRKSMAMINDITLEKDLNYRAYFDSYPFTLSPNTRGVR